MASDVLDKPARSQARRLAETRESLRKAEMLLEVSHKIAVIEGLDNVLVALVEIISEQLKAERSTLFLNDPASGELYSRIAQGTMSREIRFMNNAGIAGAVFASGAGEIIADPYGDERFNPQIDEKTGFTTRSIVCAPVKTASGEVIGVTQALNKKKGKFDQGDLDMLEAITSQAAVILQSKQLVEQMEKARKQEIDFLNVVSDVTSELELGTLLTKVMEEATRMLNADRSTLFLNDEKTGELFSRIAMGDTLGEIRLPNHAGIAGAVFTSGKTVNIPYAYADLRFNPSFDKKTGYFTRSILCVPVVNKNGKTIGVTQVLNKKSGAFSYEDETRLKAFTAQVSISLENAKLFEDVQNMKNYNESILESMTNGVITMNEDGNIVTCNGAGLRIMNVEPDGVLHKNVDAFFAGRNAWLAERIRRVEERGVADMLMDCELQFADDTISANINVLPLVGEEGKKIGCMVMIEDISTEKRMKSTMARYSDPAIADQ
ncbi:MAG: GAF domain-containing protein, partial [Proteobacteria bacterium]|nr:GAF domain-containing protein [Pseudomonadota bacterium]